MSLSTNALTGAHSLCLFIVVVWFIYQLKRDTTFVKWLNAILSGCRKVVMDVLSGWRKAVMSVLSGCRKVVAYAASRLMNALLSPLNKSVRGRHYQPVFCIPEGSLRDPLGIPYFPHEGPSFPEGSCGETIFRRYFPPHSEE